MPGIGTNLLATRLKDLQAQGVIEARDESGYALTPDGEHLRPIVHDLIRWGHRFRDRAEPGYISRPEWDMLALEAAFRPDRASGERCVIELELDGFRFASGETQGAFTVPAGGHESFSISVDVNLMRTAPQLLFIVRDGVRREIPYELEGRFEVDIPLAPALSFRDDGRIRLRAAEIAADRSH